MPRALAPARRVGANPRRAHRRWAAVCINDICIHVAPVVWREAYSSPDSSAFEGLPERRARPRARRQPAPASNVPQQRASRDQFHKSCQHCFWRRVRLKCGCRASVVCLSQVTAECEYLVLCTCASDFPTKACCFHWNRYRGVQWLAGLPDSPVCACTPADALLRPEPVLTRRVLPVPSFVSKAFLMEFRAGKGSEVRWPVRVLPRVGCVAVRLTNPPDVFFCVCEQGLPCVAPQSA